ncbi:MAG: hypothetical protein OXF74_04270 [Rhodobacteraceae bacterium]|nr:hypothetical protein [Paracoccaceae bacterium]
MTDGNNGTCHLTFSQRHGLVPLPEAMEPEKLSKNFRIRVWRAFHDDIERSRNPGYRFYASKYQHLPCMMADFNCEAAGHWDDPKKHYPDKDNEFVMQLCKAGRYDEVLTLIEFMLRHKLCPKDLRRQLTAVFDCPPPVAYHVQKIGGYPTIVLRASLESGVAARHAVGTVEEIGPDSAKTHLRTAAESLNAGNYADSVRNSIHAMEAVARMINPDARTLSTALKKLKKKGFLKHGAMNQAFEKLYSYTSDEAGIRHSLLDKDAPDVGLDEAMFMFSVCAAGAAYLLTKHTETAVG